MKNDIPPGYLENARGDLVPESKVSDLDKLRTQVVTDLCEAAKKHQEALRQFKLKAFSDISAFLSLSLERYEVSYGGEKGNVTLTTFHGRYQVKRVMQDRITYGEEIMAAKKLADECALEWTEDANDNARALIAWAFQVDKEGKINLGRVLDLRRLAIDDPKWKRAMEAVADSLRTQGTTIYVRFFERNEATGAYEPISLDMAAV